MGGARVPVADSANNRLDVEVVGNKADAAVTVVAADKSIMAYVKGIANTVAGLEVTGALGAVDDTAVQAVGTAVTDTAIAYLKGITNAVSGTAGLTTFPASAAPANGVSLAEVQRQIYDQTGIGSTFWITKVVTSSTITQAGVDLTTASSGGDLQVDDVILRTNGTGLAAGTNFEMLTNNAVGLVNFMVTAVAGLGATKTIDFANASVTKIKTILESGKKITLKSTAADCTGAGTVTIHIKFLRLAAAATVAVT